MSGMSLPHMKTMQRHRARPDPVSCQSCRSKKLRCNRVQPCSNCAARGITCTFLVPPQNNQPEPPGSGPGHAELLKRIEKLESLLQSRSPHHDVGGTTRLHMLTPYSETIHSEPCQEPDVELQGLQEVGSKQDSLSTIVSRPTSFAVNCTRNILQASYSHEPTILQPVTATLPDYSVAVLLLANYEDNIDDVCRILHVPTLRVLMKAFYTGLGRQAPVQPGHGALFLSIFALSAYFYLPNENSEVVTSGSDAVRLAIIWSKAALEVLDHVKATASEGVETIQAYIILSYVTYHLDGFTAKGRHLRSAAVSLAVDIGLHRVDAAGTGPRMSRGASPRDTIDQEVKRRIFWHIVATDWLQSTLSGPQEGMYFIHPNHIKTDIPKDCDDDSILMDGENHPDDGSHLTSMTWYLTRVKLAQLCRQVTDTLPLGISELVQLPYDHIIDLDKRFLDFFSGSPFYLRQDSDSREKSKAIETVYPRIPGMRYCIITAAHSRRCRLHQKFLLRQSSDPRYAYSRQACLESARAVVRAYDDSKFGYESPAFASARMAMAVHFTHLGLVVLVMDLCFNRGLPGEEERKAEVKAALSLLEEASDASSLISQSLAALQGMLRKHNIDLGASSQIDHHPQQPDSANEESADTRMQIAQPDFEFPASDVSMDPSFDEFWQFAVQDDINQDSGVWDNFFSALDARPL